MRERILAVATSQFVERGFDGVSMREIADECGITKAALYYHYAGKAELLDEIVGDYLTEVAAVVASVVNNPDLRGAEARLRGIVTGLFALPAQRRAILRLAMHDVGQLLPERRARFAEAYRAEFLDPLRGVITDGIEAGQLRAVDPDFCVKLLLGMLYPFFAPAGPTAHDDAGEVDALAEVLINGLRA